MANVTRKASGSTGARSLTGAVCAALTFGGTADAGQGPDIVGGETTTGFPAVAALIDANDDLFCTAVLIGPSCLLTAAHCFDSGNDFTPGMSAYFGYDLSLEADFRISLRDVHVHPEWDGNAGEHDLAVVELVAATDIAPIARTTPGAKGSTVTLVGFGYDESFVSGIKRTGTTTVFDNTGQSIFTDGTTTNTCGGDSGGPILRDVGGQLQLSGVVSGGDQDCEIFGISTRLDVNEAGFITPYAELCTATTVGSDILIDGFEHGSDEHWSDDTGNICPTLFSPPSEEHAYLYSSDPFSDVGYLGTVDVGLGAGESILQVLVWESYGGPTTPGPVDLTTDGNDNYSTCGTCVLLGVDCAGGTCAKYLFQREGTMDITALVAQEGETFAARIDATLEEVTLDPGSGETTPVPGGCVLPIHGYEFSVPLEPFDPKAPVGFRSSEKLAAED